MIDQSFANTTFLVRIGSTPPRPQKVRDLQSGLFLPKKETCPVSPRTVIALDWDLGRRQTRFRMSSRHFRAPHSHRFSHFPSSEIVLG